MNEFICSHGWLFGIDQPIGHGGVCLKRDRNKIRVDIFVDRLRDQDLSGKITSQTQFERNDDVRNWVPQLSRRNIEGNQPIVEMLKDFAAKKNATPAQISLAWMLHKYPNVVPIPGSKNKERIIENLDSANVELTEDEFTALEEALNSLKVYGHRGLGGF